MQKHKTKYDLKNKRNNGLIYIYLPICGGAPNNQQMLFLLIKRKLRSVWSAVVTRRMVSQHSITEVIKTITKFSNVIGYQ